MGKKFRLRITTLIIASIILIGSSMMASAATGGACQHNNLVRKGSVVGNWSGSHMVTLQGSQGAVRCDYSHTVTEEFLYCTDCGYTIPIDTYHHENHTVCGASY